MNANLKELKRLLLEKYTEDSWWVAVNGEVQDDHFSLLEIYNIVEENPEHKVSVLHTEDTKSEIWLHIDKAAEKLPPPPTERPAEKSTPAPVATKKTLTLNTIGKKTVKISQAPFSNVPEEVAPTPVTQAPPTQTVALRDSEEVAELLEELKRMKKEFLDGIKELQDLKESLDEREEFILESEERLMEKVHEQEHRATELDQRAEDLHNLEEAINEKKVG